MPARSFARVPIFTALALSSALGWFGAARPACAAPPTLAWSTLDGGGSPSSTGGSLRLSGTIGQPDPAVLTGGLFSLRGGFWVSPGGGLPTGVALGAEPALRFSLRPLWPNPFAGSAVVEYTLPASMAVGVRVYDVQGREVRTLVNARRPAGVQRVSWDGRDGAGRLVASGVYFVKVAAGGNSAFRRIVRID